MQLTTRSNNLQLLIQQFGLFAVCDGHGGPSAAISASKLVFCFSL